MSRRSKVDSVSRYVERVGARRLGVECAGPPVLEVLAGGRTSAAVLRWRAAAERSYVIHAWRFSRRSRQARNHAEGAGVMAQAGVRVPRVVLVENSWRCGLRYGVELVVEEEVGGSPAKADRVRSPRFLDHLARDVARIHSVKSDVAGKPWQEHGERDPRRYWEKRVARLAERGGQGAGDIGASEIAACVRLMQEKLARIEFSTPVMVHGDLKQSNLLLDENDEITFIDFGTLHFGHPAGDLAVVKNWAVRHGIFEEFARLYEQHGGAPVGAMAEAIAFFDILVPLEKIHRRARGLRRGRGKVGPERMQAEKDRYEEQIRAILAAE